MNLCSRFLRLSVIPWCRERPQVDMCSLEWPGRFKCRATGLDASLSSFSASRRCSRNRTPSRLPVWPMYSFLHNVQVMQYITFAEVHVKRSVILTDRLGSDILSAFWTKGQVFHRERAQLKVPGVSIALNVLLTRKLPTFLSRLNEISSSCEKITLVSGSFCNILKLFRMMALTELLWGWMEFSHSFPFVTFVLLTVDQCASFSKNAAILLLLFVTNKGAYIWRGLFTELYGIFPKLLDAN